MNTDKGRTLYPPELNDYYVALNLKFLRYVSCSMSRIYVMWIPEVKDYMFSPVPGDGCEIEVVFDEVYGGVTSSGVDEAVLVLINEIDSHIDKFLLGKDFGLGDCVLVWRIIPEIMNYGDDFKGYARFAVVH